MLEDFPTETSDEGLDSPKARHQKADVRRLVGRYFAERFSEQGTPDDAMEARFDAELQRAARKWGCSPGQAALAVEQYRASLREWLQDRRVRLN